MALLSISGLKVAYGPIVALHGIDLTVQPSEVVTIIGANGAGKTSTLMTVSGCVRPAAGTITFADRDITATPAEDRVRMGLAQSPEGRKIFPRLTVWENLQMGAFTRDDREGIRAEAERMVARFPILGKRRTQLGGTLSGGEQQMLAIARALMSRPKLLLLDEPSLGLAPKIVAQIFDIIRELNDNGKGMAILLVEQNARQALKVAQRAYVMETGRLTASAPAAELLDDPRIRAAYLGE